jgi:hypothetical protein
MFLQLRARGAFAFCLHHQRDVPSGAAREPNVRRAMPSNWNVSFRFREYFRDFFTRVCAAATGILHGCPGNRANLTGAFWDYTSLAPLVRSLVRACLLLFYLGTEPVAEDEAQARLIVMQLRDCTERLNYFRNAGSDSEDLRGFEALADDLRAKLYLNQYYSRLPTRLRKYER